MTTPADRDDALRQRLAEALHDVLDGDYLPGAGMGVANEGADVPIREARNKELVWWAVRAALPVVREYGDQRAGEAKAGQFWTDDEWQEWSNELARLIPDGDESRYSNPEGAQECIIQDCLAAYVAERAEGAAALTAAVRDDVTRLSLVVSMAHVIDGHHDSDTVAMLSDAMDRVLPEWLAEVLDAADTTALDQHDAQVQAEHRGEWADYFEVWTQAVGPEPLTVDLVITALRNPNVPFGIARADAQTSEGCDCTELCNMGPTCPGGMLAELPGSGCWRASEEADRG